MRNTKRTYKDSLFRDIFNHANRLPDIYETLIGGKVMPEDIVLTTINETALCLKPSYCRDSQPPYKKLLLHRLAGAEYQLSCEHASRKTAIIFWRIASGVRTTAAEPRERICSSISCSSKS